MSFSILLLCLSLVRLGLAGYVLEDDYSPSSFFSMFDFFTSSDPTHGFVSYVDEGTAQSSQLINSTSDSVYIGVDYTNVQSGGRPSVRLTSQKSYNQGLVILDLAHMPGGECGTWPAFWMVGPNWPSGGEIDIIEGVNQQSANQMTLHTGPGCSISNAGSFLGSVLTTDCDVNDPNQATNAGCGIASSDSASYGTGFNAAGGGVYATLWTADGISVYFFSRSSIPSDISSGNPDPSGWGTPQASFSGSCDFTTSFTDLQIVFDMTFCGDWAGAVWGSGSCASAAGSCTDYVANNPAAFSDAYWSINSLQVFQQSNDDVPAPSSTPAPVESSTPVVVPSSTPIETPSSTPVETPSSTPVAVSIFTPSFHHHHHTASPSAAAVSTPVVVAELSTPSAAASSSSTFSFSILGSSVSAPSTTPSALPPPFPAGNSTQPLPSGSAASGSAGFSGRPFPTGIYHHHHPHPHPSSIRVATEIATEVVVVTVTDYLTVVPTPAAAATSAGDGAIVAAEITTAAVTATPTPLMYSDFPGYGKSGGIRYPAARVENERVRIRQPAQERRRGY